MKPIFMHMDIGKLHEPNSAMSPDNLSISPLHWTTRHPGFPVQLHQCSKTQSEDFYPQFLTFQMWLRVVHIWMI